MLAANCMEPDSLDYSNIVFSWVNCFPIVWWGIVAETTVRAIYLTRQHSSKTVPEGEDNNMFST